MGGNVSRSPVLPMPGAGRMGVGCADLMVDSNGQDNGVFCRIYYPTDNKIEDFTVIRFFFDRVHSALAAFIGRLFAFWLRYWGSQAIDRPIPSGPFYEPLSLLAANSF